VESDEIEVFALLRQLDHPPPSVTMDRIVARAEQRRGAARHWRWAAAILLTTTVGGVAWATPGSPVRGWIAAAIERVAGTRKVLPPRESSPAPDAPAVQRPGAGIAVPPGRALAVVFTAPDLGGTAQVVLTDEEDVVVRTTSDAVGFTAERDRLLVETRAGAPDFEIGIPRAAPRVEIRVGDTRVFLKEGRRVTAPDSAGPGGPYRVTLAHVRGES
jgi:hypothetical protein